MRYLFLLGVLPTTFGSLYSLGYTPLQIMVIGAYIGQKLVLFSSSQNNLRLWVLLIWTWFLKNQVWKIKMDKKSNYFSNFFKIKCRSIGSQVKMKLVPNAQLLFSSSRANYLKLCWYGHNCSTNGLSIIFAFQLTQLL